jgi:hypothetical protein
MAVVADDNEYRALCLVAPQPFRVRPTNASGARRYRPPIKVHRGVTSAASHSPPRHSKAERPGPVRLIGSRDRSQLIAFGDFAESVITKPHHSGILCALNMYGCVDMHSRSLSTIGDGDSEAHVRRHRRRAAPR